jgi:ribosomal protein S15P/S13E
MANLQQIAHKYRVSENYLNSKEDGLLIVAESIKDLARELNTLKIDENRKQSMIEKMERLSEFCKDVKNSGV